MLSNPDKYVDKNIMAPNIKMQQKQQQMQNMSLGLHREETSA